MLLVLGAHPALAATINVGRNYTLSQVITSANNDIAVAGCTRGRGADRIVLPANSTQTLTAVNNNVYGPTGLPVIRSQITIAGNGSTSRRAPTAPNFRILAVAGDLTLQRTTVGGGVAAVGDPVDERGGGIFLTGGRLTITNSTISGNTAAAGKGGAVQLSGEGSLARHRGRPTSASVHPTS